VSTERVNSLDRVNVCTSYTDELEANLESRIVINILPKAFMNSTRVLVLLGIFFYKEYKIMTWKWDYNL
jgi:hypothetical protein